MSGKLTSPPTIVGCCRRECQVEKRFLGSNSDEEEYAERMRRLEQVCSSITKSSSDWPV